LRKYSIEPHVLICLSVEEVLNRNSCDTSTERHIITWGSIEYFLNWETNYHMRFYWVLPQLRDKLSHEVLLSTFSTERKNITSSCYYDHFHNWKKNNHMMLYWVLPQLRDTLSHEVLLSTSSSERQIITWGSIEYFLNWETNYHMRLYCVLFPQRKELSSHEVLLSTSSTERKIITWGSIEYSIEPHVIMCLSVEEVLNRTSCDNLSLSWGSTQ
jgi:hypothetical protein